MTKKWIMMMIVDRGDLLRMMRLWNITTFFYDEAQLFLFVNSIRERE
jgi:hypothetical protein